MLTAYLMCKDTGKAINWYRGVFGAEETRSRLIAPDGTCMNAEIRIGESRIMLADEAPSIGSVSPENLNVTSVVLNLQVPDVDKVFSRAVSEGATEIFPVADQFYGDRAGRFRDPFGHSWILATKIEEVSDEEMLKRFGELFG